MAITSKKGVRIAHVTPDSIAAELEIIPGSFLVSINGIVPKDILEFQFFETEEQIDLVVQTPEGELVEIDIEKDTYEPLGLEFASPVFDGLRLCKLDCGFCFVKQMPPGLRKSLYYRDDDYRLSFLNGNFITASNLTGKDLEKIIAYRLSPLYLSLHAVSPEIRLSLLGDRHNRILQAMQTLEENHIEVHVQLVVCPGINDGEELRKSIDYCISKTNVLSIGIVPVGMTDHLPSRYRGKIIPFTADSTQKLMRDISGYYDKRITLADEFYLSLSKPIPETGYYGDFPQIENGIGLTRAFLDDLLQTRLDRKNKYLVLTGTLFADTLRGALPDNYMVQPVVNTLFGSSITVSGLLSGKDVREALKGTGDLKTCKSVLLSAEMINEDRLFIDDVSVSSLEREFGIRIQSGYVMSDCTA